MSALLILHGVTWFFIGPRLSWIEELGILEEFRQAYPVSAANYAINARQVAIWYTSSGLLALIVALVWLLAGLGGGVPPATLLIMPVIIGFALLRK